MKGFQVMNREFLVMLFTLIVIFIAAAMLYIITTKV